MLLALLALVVVPAQPTDAAAGDWLDGLKKWATQLEQKIRSDWEFRRAQRMVAQAQAEAEARVQQEVLARQAIIPEPGVPRSKVQTIAPPPGFLTPQESAMIDAINAERAAAGLGPVAPELRLIEAARAHSAQMRQTAALDHTPRRQLASIVPGTPRSVSENIGVGWSIESLHRTFMASRSHKAVILGRFDHVGVGVVIAPGRIWVTQEFMRTR